MRVAMAAIGLVFAFPWSANADAEKEAFWNAVDAAHRRIRDARFLYEGTIARWTTSTLGAREKVVQTGFSCETKWHRDGVLRWESRSRRLQPADARVSFGCESIRLGGERLILHHNPEMPQEDAMEMQRALYCSTVGPFCPANFWGVPRLGLVDAQGRRDSTLLPAEKVDGVACRVVEFRLEGFWSAELPSVTRCYVDLERDANVLRVDHIRIGQVFIRDHGIRLSRVADAEGNLHWIPAEATHDVFQGLTDSGPGAPPHIYFATKPVYTSEFKVLADSVKINTGLSAADVELKVDPKLRLIDKRQPLAAKAGSDPPRHVPSTATADDVQRVLKAAEEQQADIRQQARQSETDWLRIGTFGLAVAGLAGLILVWFLRRSAGS